MVIIGAGVCGCAVARELSRRKLKIAVLEKETDVCEGTSKANSGIVHAGYDALPGTLKAKLNVKGSRAMKELCRRLDVPYRQNGSLVLCFDEKDKDRLEALKRRGEENGVEGLTILNRKELLALEPGVSENAVAALYAPTGGIVCPFSLTIALAENAAENGAAFYFGTRVLKVRRTGQGYDIETEGNTFRARVVVNAAGVHADEIHNMVCGSGPRLNITPRKGEYLLFDKEAGGLSEHTLFQLPTSLGKGVLVTPTVHGNLMIGPTAEEIQDKEETKTTAEGISQLMSRASQSIRELPGGMVITSFAGLRAHEQGDDFVIEELKEAPGFIDVAGIESPGLSCAPAIGEMVAELVDQVLAPEFKPDFKEERKGIPSMAEASEEERQRLIGENPAFANVICRCELVTEGEIMAAIHRPLGATTVDGVKRRTRAGMGRCQAGFCTPRVVEILARELSVDESRVEKAKKGSYYLLAQEGEAGV